MSLRMAISCGCVVLLLNFFVGCSKTPDDWARKAAAAEKAAESARSKGDPEAARDAADDAQAAVDKLRNLSESKESHKGAVGSALAKAELSARAAREHADFAEEEQQRRELLGTLKVRGYNTARSMLLTTIFSTLADDAAKASTNGIGTLSAIERPLAEQAWKLSKFVGRTELAQGPDWSGAASDLRCWTTNPPVAVRAFLALAFVSLGQSGLAVAELDPAPVENPVTLNTTRIYHGSRALLYAMQGWNRLATAEAEVFCTDPLLSTNGVDGRQVVALLHGIMAYEAFTDRKLTKMDQEIAESIKAWPDNPVAVWLTGEKLAVNGQWEKAAESLEAAAKGSKDEWVAQRLAQRARDLRDGKGSTTALVLDSRFLLEIAARTVWTAAGNSTPARKVDEAVDAAEVLGKRMLQKLRLIGDDKDRKKDE